MHEMWRIVVTGGPGGGKSAIGCMREHFESYGYRVIVMPEIATELLTSGFTIGIHGLTNYEFQKEILDEQLNRERRYLKRIAQMPGTKKLFIIERGAMDGKAYIPHHEFSRMIHHMGYHIAQLRDERYDGVFHLESAAVGAKEFYTTANNPARKETLEEAAEKDFKTRQAWVGHPHLRVIKSDLDFDKKMHRLGVAIERLIGVPQQIEIERKFLVVHPNLFYLVHQCGAVPIDIDQVYLQKKKGIRQRIRRRSQDGYSIFSLTHKEAIEERIHREVEKRINEKTYRAKLRSQRDHSYDIICKKRYCFLWDGQYFELDIFEQPRRYKGLALMEIELEDKDQPITMPPFIKVIQEVTHDVFFANSSLAKK